jgi:hypothetical protein
LIDAYNLQNELLFYGVVLHDSVENAHNESALISQSLKRYKTPFKNGRISHYVTDWRHIVMPERTQVTNALSLALTETDEFNALTILESLYKTVSGTVRLYVDNTIDYVQWLEKEAS